MIGTLTPFLMVATMMGLEFFLARDQLMESPQAVMQLCAMQ